MTPPPSSVPIRADVVPQVERVPRAVVESMQSLVAEPSQGAPLPAAPAQVAPALAAPSLVELDAPVAADAPAERAEAERAARVPRRAASASSSSLRPAPASAAERERREPDRLSRKAAADADAEARARSEEARSRVRLVKERLVTDQPAKLLEPAGSSSAGAAPNPKVDAESVKKESAKKERAKKSRPLPDWLQPFHSKEQDGKPPDEK